MNPLLNSKQIEYKILVKDLRGINPKLSTYKKMEEEIKRLAEELGYVLPTKKLEPPQWNSNVPTPQRFHQIHGDPTVKVQGAVFDTKGKKWGINKQQSQ